MSTPEQRARKTIDQLLTDAGWCVQDRAALNLSAGRGVAVREAALRKPLPFLYESTEVETFFTNGLDPEPRSRRVFAFHRPETLAEWYRGVHPLRGED